MFPFEADNTRVSNKEKKMEGRGGGNKAKEKYYNR